MSLGSFIGYAPGMFAYTLYGSILDANPGLGGYKRVWLVMFAFSLMGLRSRLWDSLVHIY